jgi:hypothetical protein
MVPGTLLQVFQVFHMMQILTTCHPCSGLLSMFHQNIYAADAAAPGADSLLALNLCNESVPTQLLWFNTNHDHSVSTHSPLEGRATVLVGLRRGMESFYGGEIAELHAT